MSTSRTKRWNGTLESLAADYLKAVIERMDAYGDRVQFELPGHGKRPIYQVINGSDRKMGFDGNHLLLKPNESGNVADSLSPVFTLNAVRDAAAGRRAGRASTRSSTNSTGSGVESSAARRRVVSAAPATDTVEQEKYTYYRTNRDTLPENIVKHATEISQLMRSGLSAEAAFQQIIDKHY